MTHNDETLDQRYQREHDAHLATLAAMTPEQIFGLEVEAHNALAEVEKLKARIVWLECEEKVNAEPVAIKALHEAMKYGTGVLEVRHVPMADFRVSNAEVESRYTDIVSDGGLDPRDQPPTNDKTRNEFIVDCQQLQAEVDRLKAQRDELVAGLKNARYRVEESGRIWNGMGWTLTGLHPHNQQKVIDEIHAALSRIEVKP